jgi:hypothetical protein
MRMNQIPLCGSEVTEESDQDDERDRHAKEQQQDGAHLSISSLK